MAIRLYAATAIIFAVAGGIGFLEFNEAKNHRYTVATVTDVKLNDCSVSNKKWRVVYKTTYTMNKIDCDLAEMLVGYDNNMKGGDITYNYDVSARYVDPVDGQTRTSRLYTFPERFVVKPGGQVLIRTHKTKAGVVSTWRWTENLSLAGNGA